MPAAAGPNAKGGALSQCQARDLAQFCDFEDQPGSTCQLIGQRDLKAAGWATDRLLDAAAAITRDLPDGPEDGPEDGPPRVSYLHQLVQSAAEAGRWERAEAFLEDLQREPPVRESRYVDSDAVRGYALLRHWLTDVVAARDIGIPLPTVPD
ncbi:MAG: hypothetical protein NXI18_09820 [Alphaproteobacteria bacterium]|nr:hypothetical protein [Alphaproteobacteria bacterium]